MTTHQPTSITHDELPAAVFQPRPDTNGRDTAYYGAHLFMGTNTVCETVIDHPGAHPRYFIETPEITNGLTLPQLHEFVATINAYYRAVIHDHTYQPTDQQKGA